MKKLALALLLAGCSTTPKPVQDRESRLAVIGTDRAALKSMGLVDLAEKDWQGAKNSCVTHLYECQYNEKGAVTGLKALDQSEPTFQQYTEEALRSWSFQSGKGGSCFVQAVYENGRATRALMVSKDVAETMLSNLKKNRAVTPKEDESKPMPTKLKEERLRMPPEMALKGKAGFATLHFDLDPEGVPTNISVVDAEPENGIEKNAIEAVKNWRYASLASEPQSRRSATVTMTAYVVDSPDRLSPCDTGLKLNRLAKAQENTTGPLQAPKPSLK